MTLNLDKLLQKWVAKQAASLGYKNEEAYIAQVLREEKKRQVAAKLMKDMEDADASGFVEASEEMWQDSIKKVKARYQARKNSKVK